MRRRSYAVSANGCRHRRPSPARPTPGVSNSGPRPAGRFCPRRAVVTKARGSAAPGEHDVARLVPHLQRSHDARALGRRWIDPNDAHAVRQVIDHPDVERSRAILPDGDGHGLEAHRLLGDPRQSLRPGGEDGEPTVRSVGGEQQRPVGGQGERPDLAALEVDEGTGRAGRWENDPEQQHHRRSKECRTPPAVQAERHRRIPYASGDSTCVPPRYDAIARNPPR